MQLGAKNRPPIFTIWTTWSWRNLGARAWTIGIALTLATAGLDWTDHLHPIERWFYNQRALHCQFFTPPPTDRLVHVDIDDSSLETIGRWPWHRTRLAEIIDELRLAGAEALSLDILLADPQDPRAVAGPGGKFEPVDDDANLANALRRFGKVMTPVSFTVEPRPAPTPQYAAMLKALLGDLELSRETVATRITSEVGGAPVSLTEDEFLFARRQAMDERLAQSMDHGVRPADEIRRRLLPSSQGQQESSSLLREFNKGYKLAASAAEIERFALSPPHPGSGDVLPPLIAASEELPMILPFATATSYSGYVNYIRRPEDPVIRALPLCIEYRGRIYPQMEVSLASAMLGADPHKIQFRPGQMILVGADSRETVIPVHEVYLDKFGRVGMFLDIPWFGTRDWKTMYDYPHYKRTKQHVPITLPWALAETRKLIARNNAEAAVAIQFFSDAGLDSAKAFQKDPPGIDRIDARIARLSAIVAEAGPLAGSALNVPFEKLTNEDDKIFMRAYNAIHSALTENQADVPLFNQKAAELRTALAGKAVIIGGTSTALGDLLSTPLHDECPGVVIHGVIFNAIISGHFWRSAPRCANLLITLAAGILTTLLVARHTAIQALISTLLLGGVYLLLNSIVLFSYGKWIVGMAGPIVAMMLIWGALTLVRFIAEAQERARITRRFSSYVDPSLVKYVIEHPELARLEGEVREMTVCFTDLAGFTTMTEKLREKAVKILGRYIVKMVPPIRRNSGLVHRFMGDGIMFSYGAPIPNPNMAIDAVKTILEMHDELAKFNEELVTEGYSPLGMRAGVNTGMAVVGDSGADDASEYACLGDTTNLAARLEGANAAMGTASLISGRTAELLDGQFLIRPIAKLIVKGKSLPVMTYEPLAPMQSATESQKRLAELTTTMFEHFIAARFAECIAAADRLDVAFGQSKLSALYRELSTTYLTDPPKDFDGHVVLQGK